MSRLFSAQSRFVLVIVGWLSLIACGFGALAAYASTPGAVGEAPSIWPSDDASGMQLAVDTHTVVLAVHPRCPCTRATINELERTLARADEQPTIYALIFEPGPNDPSHVDESFARTRIAERLGSFPGVVMIADPGSEIAKRFGALTSGHTLVYDTTGSLVFTGGLTPTRSHEGPNTGTASLVELLNGRSAIADQTPVYGCPLCSECPDVALDVCSKSEELP